MRLLLHTASYWLVLTIRAAIPRLHPLAGAQFNTIHLRLLKLAAHISETATRVRIAFAATCADAAVPQPRRPASLPTVVAQGPPFAAPFATSNA
jgi:hypothetical protein